MRTDRFPGILFPSHHISFQLIPTSLTPSSSLRISILCGNVHVVPPSLYVLCASVLTSLLGLDGLGLGGSGGVWACFLY